jgi:hypothetical protein
MLTIDPSYAEAVVNPDTRFPTLVVDNRATERLNAIYIPTQRHRPPPLTSLELLAAKADEVHLLFSAGELPAWLDDFALPNVVGRTLAPEVRDRLNSELKSSVNPSNRHAPGYDIPFKRNVALMESRWSGRRTIGLLDDDILLTAAQLDSAATALSKQADLVSFHVLDYPDVSTIDHVERLIRGVPSRVSIGGNCLFFRVEQAASFFPEVYNDDWFFLFSHVGLRRIASLGVAKQRPYRPWVDHGRIAFEQFGDIAIEGAKENIKDGRLPFDGSPQYWRVILDRYLTKLNALISLAPDGELGSALFAARQVASALESQSFFRFLERYRTDVRAFERCTTLGNNGPE